MAEIQCINKCGNLSNEGSDYCEDCEYGIGNGETMTKKEFNGLFKLPRIEERDLIEGMITGKVAIDGEELE